MISKQHVSVDDAVRALTAVGVEEAVANEMVWARKFSYVGRWVIQRSLLEEWVAVFEGAEQDVDGS